MPVPRYTPPMRHTRMLFAAALLPLGACAAPGADDDVKPESPSPAETPVAAAPPVAEVPAPQDPPPAGAASAAAGTHVQPPDALPDAPPDFALSVSVLTPQGLRTANLPPERRAARYIVGSDWILRAQVGVQLPRAQWSRTGGAERTYPGQTRQLSRDQAARLWWLAGHSGARAPGVSRSSTPPDLYQPDRDRLVYIVSVSGEGRRTWAVLDDRDLPTDAGAPLVRELAALAYQE